MTKKDLKFIFYLFITIILTLGVSISLQSLLAAWTAPSNTPPTCNSGDPGCDAPLNISNTQQQKAGALVLNTNGSIVGLVVDQGNVGIGLIDPSAKLRIEMGDLTYPEAAEGLHITRGASGAFSYLNIEDESNKPIFKVHESGRVGIGTTDPGAKLEVNGNIIANEPIDNNHVATKGWVESYVDALESGGGAWGDCTIREVSGTTFVTAVCNADEQVVGGGCQVQAGWNDINWIGGRPINNGWSCRHNNAAPNIVASAICCSNAGGSGGGGGGGSTFTKCQVKYNVDPIYPTCPDGWTAEHTYASAKVYYAHGGNGWAGIDSENTSDDSWYQYVAANSKAATLSCTVCEKEGGGGGVTCDEVLTSDSGTGWCGYSAHEYCQAQGYQYAMPNSGSGCYYQRYPGECGASVSSAGYWACSQKNPNYRIMASPSMTLWCCK